MGHMKRMLEQIRERGWESIGKSICPDCLANSSLRLGACSPPHLASAVTFSMAVACFLVACGGNQERGSSAESSTSNVTDTQGAPQIPHPCPGGKTRPLDIQTVTEVARRHGITLYANPQCTGDPTVVSEAANTVAYGPNKNVDRYDEITRREGDIACLLYAQPSGSGDKTVRLVHYPGDEETSFTLLNVVCVIYPEPDNAKEQLRRLQETMDELQERSRVSS